MTWRHVGACAAVLLLSACATYKPKPLDVAGMQRVRAQRTVDSVANRDLLLVNGLLQPGDAWPPKAYDRAQILVIAVARNPDIAESRAQLQQAMQGVRTAHALPNPTVGLAFEHDTQASAESQPWLWGISSNLVLDGGTRRRLDVALADANVRVGQLALNEAIWKLRDGLRRAEDDLLLARERCAIARPSLDAAMALDDAYALRVRSGEAAAGERLPASQVLNQTRAVSATCAADEVDANARLARLLGLDVDATERISLAWPGFDEPKDADVATIDRLARQARLSRPDLQAALVAYDSREVELARQVHAQYPQLSIGPGYTFDHGIRKLTLGLSAALPVFNQNQGPIAEALAQREAAGKHAEAVQADVDNDIALSRAQLAESRQAWELSRQERGLAARELARATRAWQAGAGDRVAVLTAAVADFAAAQSEVDALGRWHRAEALLENALRAPLNRDEARLPALAQGHAT
jgi:outer membrane protein TolC